EDGLPLSVVHEARPRQRNLVQAAVFRVGIHVDDAILLRIRKAAQEQIVDEAEDGATEADADCERQECQQRESGRLPELAEHKAKICLHGLPPAVSTVIRESLDRLAQILSESFILHP